MSTIEAGWCVWGVCGKETGGYCRRKMDTKRGLILEHNIHEAHSRISL